MFSALLALGSSLAWGSADFLAGLQSRRLGVLYVLFVSQAAGLVLVLPALVISGQPLPALSYCALGALAGVFNGAALMAFYRGLARGPVGLVAPIAATEAIIPVTYGLMRGERPSVATSIGIILALGGVVIACEPGLAKARADGGRSVAVSLGLALMAALCFGFFVIVLRGASEGGTLWAVTVSRVTTVGLLAAVVPAARARLARPKGILAAVLAIGALDVGASTLFASATVTGQISVVGVLGSFYPVVTIILGGIVLRERLGTLQRLGTFGAVAGLMLMTAG